MTMKDSEKSIFIGIMLTAGSAIGGGMFSLPVVSSGMWFSLAVIGFINIWAISYMSSLMILEVNLAYPVGASFDTFVGDVLGNVWRIILGMSMCFLLYILLYAYFSAYGNMAMHTLGLANEAASPWLQGGLGFLFGMFLAGAVWISTAFVGRLAFILVIGMVISFLIVASGTFANVSIPQLFTTATEGDPYFPYLWAGLPYFMTSFGVASMVPSLYKYYGKDLGKIKGSLFYGSLLALITYIVWLVITFGVIPRNEFIAINEAGGNVGDLVGALEQKIGSTTIQTAINFFSNFAIISSFLGVGLSLFDYIADSLKLDNSVSNRFFTTCITFLPPAIASFFFPHGFIAAIGFAGLVLYLGYFLIPFLMVWKFRADNKSSFYRLSGGKLLLIMVLILSTITAICKVLTMLKILPTF